MGQADDERQAMDQPGRRLALVVGVSSYDSSEHISPLPFAANDAVRLRDVLCEQCGFSESQVKLLVPADSAADSAEPTRPNILNALQYLVDEAGPNDLLLVYFACHGVEISSRPYLLTSDTRMNVVKQTAIDVSELNSQLESADAGCLIRVFDACRSPFSVGRSTLGRMTDTLQQELLATGSGWATLSACSSGESSYETGDFEQGVFSYYLCEGLEGRAINREGIVTLDSLADYVRTSVRNWCDLQTLKQTPHFQTDISGVTELSRPSPCHEASTSEPGHPLSAMQDALRSKLAVVPADARQLTYTNPDSQTRFAETVRAGVRSVVESFRDPIVTATFEQVEGGLQNARAGAWTEFSADLKTSRAGEEFGQQTEAMEVLFRSSEVVIPRVRLIATAARFHFFLWLWYQITAETPEGTKSFGPKPPKHKGFFTFKPKAADDPKRVEDAVREMFGRVSEAMTEWTSQMCDHLDARLAPLRKFGDVIE